MPDIEVKSRMEGIRKGKDKLLEKADEIILKKANLPDVNTTLATSLPF